MVDLGRVRHIFFDLDDTLWDFETNSENVLKELFEEHKLDTKLQSDFHTFHVAYRKKNSELWQLYNNKKIAKDDLRKRRFHETFLQFGFDNFELSYTISELYISRSPYGKELNKGSLELLELLNKKYKLHIITNGFKEVQHIKIENCGIKSYFQSVLISEEIGHNKPNIEIFRAAETISNAKSTECLMIGDNFDTDIKGAKNAGWQYIWYNPSKSKRHQIPQIHCLTELLDKFNV